jgi:hypothetical protein
MIPLKLSNQELDIIFKALSHRPFAEVEDTIVNLRSQVQTFFAEEAAKATPKPKARKPRKVKADETEEAEVSND